MLEYAVEAVGTTRDTVTITWVDPSGPDVVQAGLPLSGRVYWPGTVIEGGTVVDWPGWTRQPDGTWIEDDAFSFTRPAVRIDFEVNPSASTVVAYPEATATCASPTLAAPPATAGRVPDAGSPVQQVAAPLAAPAPVAAARAGGRGARRCPRTDRRTGGHRGYHGPAAGRGRGARARRRRDGGARDATARTAGLSGGRRRAGGRPAQPSRSTTWSMHAVSASTSSGSTDGNIATRSTSSSLR